MSVYPQQALAGLKVLLHVARADGQLAPFERQALVAAMGELRLTSETTIESLMAQSIDFDAELLRITSPRLRSSTYEAAFIVACAHGSCSIEQKAALERMRIAFEITDEDRTLLEHLVGSISQNAQEEEVLQPVLTDTLIAWTTVVNLDEPVDGGSS